MHKEYCNGNINFDTYGCSFCYIINLNKLEIIGREKERKYPTDNNHCYFAFSAVSIVVGICFLVVWSNSWTFFTAARQRYNSPEGQPTNGSVPSEYLSTIWVPACSLWSVLALSRGEAGHSAKWLPCFTPLLDWDCLLFNMCMENGHGQTWGPKLQSSGGGKTKKEVFSVEKSLQRYTEQTLFMHKLDSVSKRISWEIQCSQEFRVIEARK